MKVFVLNYSNISFIILLPIVSLDLDVFCLLWRFIHYNILAHGVFSGFVPLTDITYYFIKLC